VDRVKRVAVGRALVDGADGLLSIVGTVVGARSRLASILLLAALATSPMALALGALAALTAALAVRSIGLDSSGIKRGAYGYNALLAGAGVAHALPVSAIAIALVITVAAAIACVLVTAAWLASIGRVLHLPALSIPFVVVYAVALGVGPVIGAPPHPFDTHLYASTAAYVLEGLGYIVFAPSVLGGALVLAAIVVHSRIAATLSLLGLALIFGVASAAPAPIDPVTIRIAALNASLTAIAVGGVWFVPSRASYALGVAASLVSALVTLGLVGASQRIGLPVLIVPFNVSVLLVLLTARLRAFDRAPKSADVMLASPEETLAHYRAREARFAVTHGVAIHLPFRGAWTCTQGVDGALTHKEQWRHAFDFEVRGADGLLYRDAGRAPEDHHCHGLPVLACADGTVAMVVSDVDDNEVGRIDVARNWGNVVMLCHAPGLYSLVAHLAKGSARVHTGQVVRRGDVLGACGNSGRSPRPHLHFQLQSSPTLGAPTLPCRLHEVIARSAQGEVLHAARVVEEGDSVRALEPDETLAELVKFTTQSASGCEFGDAFTLCEGQRSERIACDVDLFGATRFRSETLESELYFARSDEGFVAYEATGDRRSLLHLLRAAIPRVPFDGNEALSFVDLVPFSWRDGRWVGALRDVLAPLESEAGVEVRYRTRRRGERLVIEGESTRKDASGAPLVRTLATLCRTRGVLSIEVRARGATRVAVRQERAVNDVENKLPERAMSAALERGGSR
jgi:urea transporter